ncbi:nucleoside monophosphate kinase [Candidatus Woesearchaeota archaeon]|nr:nucleoside monophosphate kinase [Candidatus Woesearchaeota archaeon]
MKIVFLGSPGVGKGTYADILSRYYKIPHISTGNIFRAMKHDNSELGKKVKALIEAGQFVDDKTTLKVIDDRLSNPDCKNGYILDGFPRTLYQAKHFINIDTVLNFDANEKRIIERLSGRRTCLNKSCQAIYHIKNNPPKIKDTCDRCGGSLVQRKDERPEIIKERLRIYEEKTKPLITFYKPKNKLHEINANGKIPEIIEECKKVLDLFK